MKPWIAFLCGLAPLAALAGMPFPAVPDWVSTDVGSVSTGGALADLDRDGWLDLVVSNGNDILRQPLVVYYNRGDGTFPDAPDWASVSTEYHGHLDVGDVNQDGWLDVAVAVYLGAARWGDLGWAALYLNDGAGTLEATPSWTSSDRFYSFSVALGDADSDGDLDLAVATGEPYHDAHDVNRVYFNQGGALAATAGWVSDEQDMNLAVAFGDANNDGRLDIAFSGSVGPHRVYHQTGSGLETTASWQSAADSPMGDRLSLGDLDRDGYTDLAVSENDQLGGVGRFRVFPGTASGLSPTDNWASNYAGYGSEAVIGDANGDGWPDLLCGSWGGLGWGYVDQVRIYPNRYVRGLDGDPGWISGTGSVIERILLGDVDNDGLVTAREVFPAAGGRALFFLARAPFQTLLGVTADGVPLGPADFCCSAEAGWISLAGAPLSDLVVDYVYSVRPDLAVTNWDTTIGNYLFYARDPVLLYAVRGPTGTELRLPWTGGLPPYDVIESSEPGFAPGLALRAEGLGATEWSDAPGTLGQGSLLYYRVY